MEKGLSLCQRALLDCFVNYSGADCLWFLTHNRTKWERAGDYLERLHLAGFSRHDETLMAPMGMREPWTGENTFLDEGYTIFDIPDFAGMPINQYGWENVSKTNKKCWTIHYECIKAGFRPLFLLHQTTETCAKRIVTTTEAEGVIVSGLWSVIDFNERSRSA